MTTQITANNITNNTITVTQLVPGALSPKIKTIDICDSSYNVLDDTAANTTGGYIQITGSTFGANSQVIIGTNNATSVTFVNTSTLRAQVPAAAATSYPVYVIDGDTGATAIKINGLTQSSFPAWSTGATLSNQNSGTSFGVNLSATSDSSITYSNTSTLPDGTTLAANGYFSGTVSIGSQTTYSFDIKATDIENQDATRTFSLTVTVTPQGKIYVWGDGGAGRLGLNNTTTISSPTQVGVSNDWTIISTGESKSFGIKTDGTLWVWGDNGNGDLGLNSTINRSSPTQIGALTNWSKVSGGTNHGLAIKTDGTLWAIGGQGYHGALGLNNTNYKSSPTQIGTDTNWSLIETGGSQSAAIKTDGTLWVWGNGDYGVLGLNIVVNKSSPTQVGTGTNWSKVSIGISHSLFLDNTNKLWSCGYNTFGLLGQNDQVYRSSPVQIGSSTNWSKIHTGQFYSSAIKTDGTLWSWGRGEWGELGLNNTIYRSSPVQVGTDTNWANIGGGKVHSLITKTDGTLWSVGRNNNGQLGLNNSGINKSSPVQIGTGTNWNIIDDGYGSGHSMAVSST